MPLLQSLKNQRERKRGERRRPSKAGTSPESNPVRAFSPGSSCTPLWFPADGLSAAVVLFLRMAGDFWQGRLKPGSASAGWLSRILSPPQVEDGIAVLGLPGSSRLLDPDSLWWQVLAAAALLCCSQIRSSAPPLPATRLAGFLPTGPGVPGGQREPRSSHWYSPLAPGTGVPGGSAGLRV